MVTIPGLVASAAALTSIECPTPCGFAQTPANQEKWGGGGGICFFFSAWRNRIFKRAGLPRRPLRRCLSNSWRCQCTKGQNSDSLSKAPKRHSPTEVRSIPECLLPRVFIVMGTLESSGRPGGSSSSSSSSCGAAGPPPPSSAEKQRLQVPPQNPNTPKVPTSTLT